MQRSLYTAVTGVKSHQTYLDVTSQNIANVNTVGYKRDTIQFADMIYQTIRNEFGPVTPPGGINPAQVGLGVRVASIDPCFVQGALQSTEIPTDMAISGDGFFVVKNGDNELYTRAGNFALDFAGNLVMQGNGYLVQGYKFNGTSRGSTPEDIVIPVGDVIPQKATTLAAFRCNLDSGAEARIKDLDNIPAGADKVARPFDYTGIGDLFASVSNATGQGTITAFGESMKASCDWKDNFVVYDAEGSAHSMVVTFRKVLDRPADPTATPPVSAESEWDWYAYYTDENGNVANQYGEGAGTLVFGDNGQLKRTYTYEPTLATSGTPPTFNWSPVEKIVGLAADSDKPTGRVATNFGSGSGAITLDFLGSDLAKQLGLADSGPMGGVTSFGSDYTTKLKAQDGYPSGVLNSWSVDSRGVITGAYSNGQSRPIAQLALAMFMNPQGLDKVGQTCFDVSANSGEPRIVAPMEAGAGKIEGMTIEMSNVDLSEEFVNLIRSQRGLQANTRAVTTSDQMLEVLINLKR